MALIIVDAMMPCKFGKWHCRALASVKPNQRHAKHVTPQTGWCEPPKCQIQRCAGLKLLTLTPPKKTQQPLSVFGKKHRSTTVGGSVWVDGGTSSARTAESGLGGPEKAVSWCRDILHGISSHHDTTRMLSGFFAKGKPYLFFWWFPPFDHPIYMYIYIYIHTYII